MNISYDITRKDRKALAEAAGKLLNASATYCGAPGFAYMVGSDYHVDREGTLTGPDNRDLVISLRNLYSFAAAEESYDAGPAAEFPVMPAAEPEAPTAPEADCVCIEVPLADFTSEALDRLAAMVTAKEALIKKALKADALPIQILSDRIAFPWFQTALDGEHINAYAQFITMLCKTAREKKRVTAKAPEQGFENEKFACRVWMTGLGMVGPEFGLARKLMIANLDGNSGWRYGPPEKAPALALEDSCE